MHRETDKQLTDELHRWLAAETTGDDDGAEEALSFLFTALPRPVPSADFADRVMAAVTCGCPSRSAPIQEPQRR